MPMTVSGNLGGLAPDGSKVALANATIIVYPASNQYRVQYNGAGEFVPLVYRQDVAELPDPYRFGFLTRTDSGGAYSFKIPLASETHAIGAAPIEWSVKLPDGRQLTGTPAAAGPYSFDDLLASQSWRISEGLVVVAALNGITRDAIASVAGSTTLTVAFAGGNMPNTSYRVFGRASKDSITNAVPDWDVSSKTTSGFTVTFSPSFTGTFDWLVRG